MSKKKTKNDLKNKISKTEDMLIEEELVSIAGTEPETIPEECPDDKTVELEKAIAEWKDKYLRAIAEFENFRRRTIEEKTDWIKRATEKLALNICDVLDNFDRALQQISEDQKEDKFIKGILLIEQQLKAALEKEGVKRIDALGKDFNPHYHEALAQIPSEYEEGKVAAIIRNGYTMYEKVIRPVQVAVSIGNQSNEKKLEEICKKKEEPDKKDNI